jgi:hypothetical protein
MQHVKDWQPSQDSNNVVTNIMFVEASTNTAWLNINPADQVAQSDRANTTQSAAEIYERHGIDPSALDVLRRPEKSRADFYEFSDLRDGYFLRKLEAMGFSRPQRDIGVRAAEEADYDDELLE